VIVTTRELGRLLVLEALLVAALMFLVGCPKPYRDETVDLKQLSKPDPLAIVMPPEPVAPPPEVQGRAPEPWRAWVPRRVQPNGDVVEGHYLTISLTEPPVELLEPAKPMPRLPHGPPLRLAAPTARPQAPVVPPSPPYQEAQPMYPRPPYQRGPGYATPGYGTPGYPVPGYAVPGYDPLSPGGN
jgi:hypothetical protein